MKEQNLNADQERKEAEDSYSLYSKLACGALVIGILTLTVVEYLLCP
jgi:hypothetical protein